MLGHALPGRTSSVGACQTACLRWRLLDALVKGPGGDDLVDVRHKAHGLLEGHHDLAVVGHVVVGEGRSCPFPWRQIRPTLTASGGPAVTTSLGPTLPY